MVISVGKDTRLTAAERVQSDDGLFGRFNPWNDAKHRQPAHVCTLGLRPVLSLCTEL